MELIRKPIHYTQAGKSIFDQFYLDEDYSVPEQNADVQRVVCGSARLSAEEIRPVENYIRITGKLYFRVLYMTDPGDPKAAVLGGGLPFEENVYTETDGNETVFKTCGGSLDCRRPFLCGGGRGSSAFCQGGNLD